MKQYVIDELRPADFIAIKAHLDDQYGSTAMDGVFWIPVESPLLSTVQSAHRECGPHYFAIDLDENRLACELLVRSKNRMRCDCIHYATAVQRNWIIEFVDDIFDRLSIVT
jgi:hypothetical protein